MRLWFGPGYSSLMLTIATNLEAILTEAIFTVQYTIAALGA